MKKLLSLILAVMLIASCLPMVHAEEAALESIPHESAVVVYSNPFYGKEAEQTTPIQPRSVTVFDSKEYYTTTEEAGAVLREGAKSRKKTVAVNLTTRSEDFETLAMEIVGYAFAHTGVPTEGDYLLWQVDDYSCELDGVVSGSRYYLTFTFTLTYATTANQEKKVDTEVTKLLKQLNLYEASDYEKVKGVYDWVCANVVPATLNDNTADIKFTAYGAIVNKSAVCLGYSTLIYRLLLELGVDNHIISGYAGDAAHTWNIVLLEEEYYNIDATLDAARVKAGQDYAYFLKCDSSFSDHQRDYIFDFEEFHALYPMDDEDYVPGAIKVLASGYCGADGDEVYWKYTSDYTLTIYGTGTMQNCITKQPWADYLSKFQRIVVENGVTALGHSAFEGCTQVTEVSLPDSLKELSGDAFKECYALESIRLPAGIKTTGSYVFYDCRSLKSVELPYGLEEISDSTFQNTILESIDIPDTVTEIGWNAFAGTHMTEITIPDSVTVLGHNAFGYCPNLEKVTLSKNIKEIDSRTFENCAALKEITLPEGLTTIQSYAFSGCHSLQKLVIPQTVTFIAEIVFESDRTDMEIYFMGDPPEFRYNTFTWFTGTLYYPRWNTNWTEDVKQSYGGDVTWVPHDLHTHDYIAVTTAPTCTEQGYTTHTCSICSDSYVDTYLDALGHSYEATVTAPTCTEKGFTTHTCARCGDSYEANYTNALGHSWDEGTEIVSPAGCEDGKYLHTCTICGETEERTVPAQGHEYDPETNLCIHCGASKIQPGDANGDGTIDNVDAMLVLQYAVGLNNGDTLYLDACDVDGNGDVDNVDAMLVLQFAVGLVTVFPKA